MTFHGTLKPYQVDAVSKMVKQKKVLVAYEMGLGKTPMTIAALEELRLRREIEDTVLVLCLASLKYQWKSELEKFAHTEALVIDGSPKQRATQYARIKDFRYVVMNYEQVVNDWETIKSEPFAAIVCDEATAIKGFRAKRAKKVKELAKKIPIRYALTGTPIENGRPEEMYSIMQFVDPSVLGRFDLFDKAFIVRNHFGGVLRYRNLQTFHSVLANHTVRKSQNDEDVKPYLPDAVYREPIIVNLDPAARKLYNFIADDLIDLLTQASTLFGSSFDISSVYGYGSSWDGPENELRGQIMSRVTALRMLSSHPQLILDSRNNFENQTGKGSAYIHSLSDSGLLEKLSKTPKLDAVVGYLSEHLTIDDSYKAVIFSSYVNCVHEIVRRLNDKGFEAVPYTGQMNAKEKEAAKVRFQTTETVRVLVSSDAGGYGVDLPQANLLLNYDQPWSAGLAVQRNGRINRASSTWSTITIQDVLVKNSIEERQYAMLKQKGKVANAVLDGKGINDKGGVDLTVGSLIDFLNTRP
jgi:SNF2 family DNA or RNA helicase